MKVKRKRSERFSIFFTGFRIAAISAAILTGIVGLAGLLWLQLSAAGLVLLLAVTMVVSTGVIYFVSKSLQRRRLTTINRINRNIARKKFEAYRNLHSGHKDEIDLLITQAIRASKTVEREIQRLNKIENYRKEFIGDISHELKTPIFAIQGFVETLLDGALEDPEVNRVFLNKAMRNVNRLSYLTKDLMEISKLETGELKSSIQTLNLRSTVLDVVENLQYKAQKENVEIRVGEIDSSLHVQADRNQLRQVFINLIENGMKYNRPGGFVEIKVEPYKNDNQRLLISIRDTGIGIDPNDIPRVTERFFRVDKSRSREKGGTGLGLSIVKHIIEAHGEDLFINSAPNRGSTFSFTLTIAGGR